MIFAVRTAIGFSFKLEVALLEPACVAIIVLVGLVLGGGLVVFTLMVLNPDSLVILEGSCGGLFFEGLGTLPSHRP